MRIHVRGAAGLSLAMLCAVWGCGGGDGRVDAFLDEYQKSVEQWEAKANAGALTVKDVQEMNAANAALAAKAAGMQTASAWTDEQAKRYAELSQRFTGAVMRISASPGSFLKR